MVRKSWLRVANFFILLSILLGLGFLSKMDLIGHAKSRANLNHVFILISALENFNDDVGRYPFTEEGLRVLIFPPKNREKWKGPYITKDQLESLTSDFDKDPWGTKYVYIYPNRHGGEIYELYSCGENQRDDFGQYDDITN